MPPPVLHDDPASPRRAPIAPDPNVGTSWWQNQAPSQGFAALNCNLQCDVVVIGGGVSGCSAAWHLARAGAHVALLEARELASGASGRNGGFLLAGYAHRYCTLVDIVGTRRAAELYQRTIDGRELLYATAQAIGAPSHAMRTGSLRLAVDSAEVVELDREATALEQAGFPVERLTRKQLPGPLAQHMLSGLRFPDDGRSMPAGWVRALGAAAAQAGALVYEQTVVTGIDDGADGVDVTTRSGHTVRTDQVVVATEAWLPGLLPELAGLVLPYRSQVLAAAAPRNFAGEVVRLLPHVTWSRRGWDYAQQTADGTLIVGGEQHEDVDRLRTWDEVIEPDDQAWIERWTRRVLGIDPEVHTRWAGVLSQTPDGFPWLGPLPGRGRVRACGGWGGAGNVLGFALGGQVALDALHGTCEVPSEFAASRYEIPPTSR